MIFKLADVNATAVLALAAESALRHVFGVAAFRLETRSGGGGGGGGGSKAARRDDPRDDKERKVQSRVLSHFMISRLKCEACGASRATSSTRCTDKTATRRIREVEIRGGETRVEHLREKQRGRFNGK